MLVVGDPQDPAASGDDLGLPHPVDRQPLPPPEKADATRRREPADPHISRVARGERKPPSVQFPRYCPPPRTGADRHPRATQVFDTVQVPQIDHGPALVGRDAADPVPATADREWLIEGSGDLDRTRCLHRIPRQQHPRRTPRRRIHVPHALVSGIRGRHGFYVDQPHQYASGRA